jgi:pilus assembly protein CpaF
VTDMPGKMHAVVDEVRAHLMNSGRKLPKWDASAGERDVFCTVVAQAITHLRLERKVEGSLAEVARNVAAMLTGVGVLEAVLAQDGVEEVIVRSGGHVQVERWGQIEDLGQLASDSHFERVAERAAELGGRVLKGSRPWVLVDLPSGHRFTAMKSPLSVGGTAINIRVFGKQGMALGDLARLGAFGGNGSSPPAEPVSGEEATRAFALEGVDALPPLAQMLATVAAGNLASVLISGEFAAGKTTLLNAMSQFVPPTVQMAVVETFQELQVGHPHPLRVEVRDNPGAPTMEEVLNVVITRMRPDLLVIGEIVLDEAPRYLEAINLGKRAWGTVHGSDVLGALRRLETLALKSGLPHAAIREQVGANVDLVVHLRQDPWTGRRYVAQVGQVRGLTADGEYDVKYLYNLGDVRSSALMKVIAEYEPLLGGDNNG